MVGYQEHEVSEASSSGLFTPTQSPAAPAAPEGLARCAHCGLTIVYSVWKGAGWVPFDNHQPRGQFDNEPHVCQAQRVQQRQQQEEPA